MANKPPFSATETATGRYRVLLIDDNEKLVEPFQEGLRLMGHEVEATTSGSEALRLIHKLDPHVIVTDLIMPEIDIFDALEQMRKIRRGVKIIAISGNPHLLQLAAKSGGADHTLAKPFNLSRLDAMIKTAMRPGAG